MSKAFRTRAHQAFERANPKVVAWLTASEPTRAEPFRNHLRVVFDQNAGLTEKQLKLAKLRSGA